MEGSTGWAARTIVGEEQKYQGYRSGTIRITGRWYIDLQEDKYGIISTRTLLMLCELEARNELGISRDFVPHVS